ncbi:hypothetical protein TNCT_540111 [Trichonephila clavata]|uniref:Uncharacterized protein n=1 Tax=Trichonephila clavata TaxID=2740835 RepID=A0A8X6H8W4_TRICU|nr:hypothetical protein TNCT_540111 [Trichonephila clavata]
MFKKPTDPNEKERSFIASQVFRFKLYVLQPHTAYAIQKGTSYVLVTMQKSLFSLQRVHAHVYSQHKNVFQSVKDTDVENIKRFKDCNVPPATPAVDQLLPSLDDEEEWGVPNAEDFFRRPTPSMPVELPA